MHIAERYGVDLIGVIAARDTLDRRVALSALVKASTQQLKDTQNVCLINCGRAFTQTVDAEVAVRQVQAAAKSLLKRKVACEPKCQGFLGQSDWNNN